MPDIARIAKNEEYLDEASQAVSELLTALEKYAAAKPKLAALSSYYKTDWMTDLNDDINGLLPENLKRGVLSEDAVFDLLAADEAVKRLVSEIFGE